MGRDGTKNQSLSSLWLVSVPHATCPAGQSRHGSSCIQEAYFLGSCLHRSAGRGASPINNATHVTCSTHALTRPVAARIPFQSLRACSGLKFVVGANVKGTKNLCFFCICLLVRCACRMTCKHRRAPAAQCDQRAASNYSGPCSKTTYQAHPKETTWNRWLVQVPISQWFWCKRGAHRHRGSPRSGVASAA